MLIDIALLTGLTVHNLSRRLALMLDEKYGLGLDSSRFPSHITLKQAFSYHDDLETLARVFDTFCKLSPAPLVRYSGIEAVPGRNQTTIIWLDIVADDTLRNMHNLLLKLLSEHCGVVPGPLDGSRWRFHTTLAQAPIEKSLLPDILADARRFTNRLTSRSDAGVLLITPPGRPEQLEESVSYRIQRLTGPLSSG